ncbi:hypothetical protein E5N71_10345, partial [Candidatus Nitrosocosmicus sp. SS]
MNNSQNNGKSNNRKGVVAPFMVVITLSILLLAGPTSVTLSVFAQGNTANQGIGQSQSGIQLGVCVSGNGTVFSCNNSNTQSQTNTGSNAAAQSGGSGSGGNSATQGIGQSQTSNQNSGVTSGGNTTNSGNNNN